MWEGGGLLSCIAIFFVYPSAEVQAIRVHFVTINGALLVVISQICAVYCKGELSI